MEAICSRSSRSAVLRSLTFAAAALVGIASGAQASSPGAPLGIAPGTTLAATAHATVNFSDLARTERLSTLAGERPIRVLLREQDESFEQQNEMGEHAPVSGLDVFTAQRSLTLNAASPSPTTSFIGLDDIPMVDSMYIIIPPDVSGAVGPTRLFQGSNNDYRVLDKATGATITTVGTATFWAPVVPAANRLDLTDPRTLYDPYNNRWIAEMQTVTSGAGLILLGISQTSDPAGAWNLYSFATGATIDFPNVGFNKNWITVAINGYSHGGTFAHGLTLAVNYPSARSGTGTGTLFTQSPGTHFCSSPCVTYSPTSDTLYVITHLSSSGATYTIDAITGTAAAPVYNAASSALTRPGGGWASLSGNVMPQSAPLSGTSACGTTPCPIEAQDAQVRSAPVYRDGSIWYTQTIGLPASGATHSALQWTQLTTPSGAVVDGGRLEDATATSTNGGNWYGNVHVAVNANHDFLVGFTQFSSAQHPSTGYAMHLAGDPAGSLRDVAISHAGEDYYHKTFTTTTGRDRWGDFSTAQVDPSDDLSLWAVQEYAKARKSTDDGNTGANGSRWSTWWAAVAPPSVTLDAGPSQAEGNSGTTTFSFTARLSSAYGVPVQINWHTTDGTATAASGDYVAASSSVTIPAGATSANFSVTVNGDSLCEPDETFGVTFTGDDRSLPITTSSTSATILDDDPNAAIAASAGTGGTISPSGNVVVPCGSDQSFTITPDSGNTVSQLVVDGVSVTPATSYTFTGVSGPHSIAASFSGTTAVGDRPVAFGLGAVTPNPAHGAMQVSFGLASAAHARITVLDLQGRERAVLADGEFAPGSHVTSWNGRATGGEAGAGVYFLRYQVAGRTFLRKFALMN